MDATTPDGSKGTAILLGTALRHTRLAQSVNLRRGPGPHVAKEIQHARKALDSAAWACDYCQHEAKG